MSRRILALAAFAVLAAPAMAQDHEGLWSGQGEGDITLDLTHIEGDTYSAALETVVPISDQGGGCAGGVEGELDLTSDGGILSVENEEYDSAAEPSPVNAKVCEIALTFNADGTLTVEEKEGCLPYHGAACGFSGTLSHDAAGL
ncbi:hypothetical protein [Devosia sediminis]|uniref:DUF3617 family protein n=1 Tax=Devosia sediminis TaxID=2798801 RepID=A0A934IYD4_9HYPH|nr:hypothetical protein [Devosia sediminis]MBJ3784214.1 hypothetical protein [Devosia sediminis]